MDPPPAHGIPEHERRPRRGAIPVQPRGLSLGAPPATARPGVPRRLAALALTLMVVTAPLASAAETAQRIVSVGGSVTEVI